MTSRDLDVVLVFAGDRHEELQHHLDAVRSDGCAQDDRLDELEERIARLGGPQAGGGDVTTPRLRPVVVRPMPDWDLLVAEAERHFQERGVNPGTFDVASLLDPAEVKSLRWASEMPGEFRCRLDTIDLVTCALAGVIAGVVDIALVRIPKTMRYQGAQQQGSPVTDWLRGHSLDSDNWLSQYVKVTFDRLNGAGPDERLSPRTHRADTFGHDPLLGLVLGTVDILRGTSTGVGRNGVMFTHAVDAPVTHNPLVALALEIGHLLSDVVTKAGLPVPGNAFLRSLSFGSIDGKTIGELARQMYLRGYDSWHFLTMSTSVAAAETVLRAAWVLRAQLDEDWAQLTADEARVVRSTRMGDHPRFLAMALVTHGIASLTNAGKVGLLFGGNPLALNYSQWLWFSRAVAKWWKSYAFGPSDALAVRSDINLEALAEGWPSISSA